MGKSKPVSSVRPTRADKSLKRLRKEFEDGTLTRQQLYLIPYEKKVEYLNRELAKKYNTKDIKFSCLTCAIVALYGPRRSITDEDLLKVTGLRHA